MRKYDGADVDGRIFFCCFWKKTVEFLLNYFVFKNTAEKDVMFCLPVLASIIIRKCGYYGKRIVRAHEVNRARDLIELHR